MYAQFFPQASRARFRPGGCLRFQLATKATKKGSRPAVCHLAPMQDSTFQRRPIWTRKSWSHIPNNHHKSLEFIYIYSPRRSSSMSSMRFMYLYVNIKKYIPLQKVKHKNQLYQDFQPTLWVSLGTLDPLQDLEIYLIITMIPCTNYLLSKKVWASGEEQPTGKVNHIYIYIHVWNVLYYKKWKFKYIIYIYICLYWIAFSCFLQVLFIVGRNNHQESPTSEGFQNHARCYQKHFS